MDTFRVKLEEPMFPICKDGMQRTHREAYLMTFFWEYKMITIFNILIDVTYILLIAKNV